MNLLSRTERFVYVKTGIEQADFQRLLKLHGTEGQTLKALRIAFHLALRDVAGGPGSSRAASEHGQHSGAPW